MKVYCYFSTHHDENVLGNETSQEFKRVLYEAIEHSGVCAYSSMDGLLCNTDSYTRRNALKDAFQLYPPLKTVKKSNKITSLEHIPKNVKEMREMVFLFMQQHPFGRYFELENEIKGFSGMILKFKRTCDNGTCQRFSVDLDFSKKWDRFELGASPFLYDFFAPYIKGSKEIYMTSKGNNIKSIEFSLNFGLIKFVQNWENNIWYFKLEKDDTQYFNNFLKQLDVCLNLFASIDSLDKFIDLFLYSDQTIFSAEDNFILPDYNNREISPFGEEQLELAYKLFTYGNIYPEKRKNMEEYALNYKYSDRTPEEIKEREKERMKLFFRDINLLNDYFVNPTKDWRELVK